MQYVIITPLDNKRSSVIVNLGIRPTIAFMLSKVIVDMNAIANSQLYKDNALIPYSTHLTLLRSGRYKIVIPGECTIMCEVCSL